MIKKYLEVRNNYEIKRLLVKKIKYWYSVWRLSFKANLPNPKRITNFFVCFKNRLQIT